MDKKMVNRNKLYGRVMSRVHNRSHTSLKSNVTRHETPSASYVGAKVSSSNLSSGIYKELPLVLHDYQPNVPTEKLKKPKPKKTVKSLDPSKSPILNKLTRESCKKNEIRVRDSAPSLLYPDPVSDPHIRQCYSSRSHTRLKELKDEIKAFQETEKLMHLRSRLYKKCGVVLDDVGHVASDKAVQVEELENAPGDIRDAAMRL